MSRILLIFLALAASLEAQAPISPSPRVPLPNWRALLRGTVITPPRVCAIPLLNVLRPEPMEPMPMVRPPARGPRFPMAQIQVPAPACDNIRSPSTNSSDEQNPTRPH